MDENNSTNADQNCQAHRFTNCQSGDEIEVFDRSIASSFRLEISWPDTCQSVLKTSVFIPRSCKVRLEHR